MYTEYWWPTTAAGGMAGDLDHEHGTGGSPTKLLKTRAPWARARSTPVMSTPTRRLAALLAGTILALLQVATAAAGMKFP